MPHVPNFPSRDDEEQKRPSRGIIDRIIDDGDFPTPSGG